MKERHSTFEDESIRHAEIMHSDLPINMKFWKCVCVCERERVHAVVEGRLCKTSVRLS